MATKKVTAKKTTAKKENNPLFLEVNTANVKDDGIIASGRILVTPSVGEKDYWVLRVKLSKKQSIIAFPKFLTLGVGFSKETNWNTNLPYSCEIDKIFNHIKQNKGSKTISDENCIKAIKMIQNFIKKNDFVKKVYNE